MNLTDWDMKAQNLDDPDEEFFVASRRNSKLESWRWEDADPDDLDVSNLEMQS
jgi:hypothetical protein